MTGLTVNIGVWRSASFARFAAVVASAGIALAMGVSADIALAQAPQGTCPAGKTTENVFTRVTPLSGSTVHPGDLVGADFHDESQLNLTAPNQLQLTLAGPGGTTTLNPTITDEPSNTDGSTGEFRIVKRIRATLPSNPAPGSYTATIKGWDTDQTRTEGDCGTASWTFSVQPAPHSVVSPAATTSSPRTGVKAAAVASMPFTGRGALLMGALAGLLLVLLGMTMLLAVARSTKRA